MQDFGNKASFCFALSEFWNKLLSLRLYSQELSALLYIPLCPVFLMIKTFMLKKIINYFI